MVKMKGGFESRPNFKFLAELRLLKKKREMSELRLLKMSPYSMRMCILRGCAML